ncbi:MAG: DSBA-like thioredoxin domain, partial [Solirubrobacteraceae bacterium]|nr:DSBA-like thioredoxin domain [Solirubrobacteraceae bacterium]
MWADIACPWCYIGHHRLRAAVAEWIPPLREYLTLTMATSPIPNDVWADVACPWCYIGHHRLRQALAD